MDDYSPGQPLQQKLYIAAWRKPLPEVEKALVEGADPHYVYQNGRNLMHVTSWFNRAEIMYLLLDKKVNPKLVDATGSTALSLSIQNQSFSAFKLLAPISDFYQPVTYKGEILNALLWLAKEGRSDWCDWLEQQNLTPSWSYVCPETGNNMAHLAAQQQQWKMLQWLYQRGVSPDVKNKAGLSANDILREIPGGVRWMREGGVLLKEDSVDKQPQVRKMAHQKTKKRSA